MRRLLIILALGCLAEPAPAVVVQVNASVSGNYTTAFPVSSTDLINAGQPTLASATHPGYAPFSYLDYGTSTTAALTDGDTNNAMHTPMPAYASGIKTCVRLKVQPGSKAQINPQTKIWRQPPVLGLIFFLDSCDFRFFNMVKIFSALTSQVENCQ